MQEKQFFLYMGFGSILSFERDKVEEKNRFSMPPTPMNFKVCAVFFDIQF